MNTQSPKPFVTAAVLACASAFLITGCSGADEDENNMTTPDTGLSMTNGTDMGSADNGTTDDPDMAVADPDMAVEDSTVTMTADFLDQVTGGPLAGVEVCVLDAEPENCAETNAEGTAQLEVPPGEEVVLSAALEDYYSALYPLVMADEDFHFMRMTMVTEATAFGLLGVIGVTQDPALGAMAITIQGEGVTPVLEPAAGEEPWYLVGADISRSATGTPALLASAGIPNIPPGEYIVRFEHDTKVCEPMGVWPGNAANEQRIVVRAGYLTGLASLDCL